MASSSMFSSLLQSLPSSKTFSFRSNSGIGIYNPVLGLLESKITSQLELLTLRDEEGTGYLSAEWLHSAMSMVLFANSSAMASIPDIQHALSDPGSFSKWLDECLDDNIRLLDASVIIQETLSCSAKHLAYVKAALQPSDMLISKAALQKVLYAASESGKILQRRMVDTASKRSKLETCGSVLRRMGEKLFSLEDSYKGNGWGVMYVAHVVTIIISAVLITALSVGSRRASMTTVSISTQSKWSLALAGLQLRIKEQVDVKRSRIQRMPYLEELENVDALVCTLGEMVSEALQANQFPMPSEAEQQIRRAMDDLNHLSNELEQGLSALAQDMHQLYDVLVRSRIMLLDMYPKSSSIPRFYYEQEGKQS
ncbi:hypothetical protein KP509_15G075000 [Ceratopteris richardii]|uniref:Protein BYPASS-related n=1 Tax=Ceratopteris richardii TaxID=49495 RepID=A0A8T2TBB6_CERRI|nr:hypothetical protein KP509_15G075000 [Ceratopteris richardii]